jgi:hypothetical protein
MWNLVSVQLEKVCKTGARFAPNVHYGQKSFRTHQMALLGDEAQVIAYFGPFGDSANLDTT